ncbi:MAG: hypothetical protein V3U88_09665 [Methylococcales bacterium]
MSLLSKLITLSILLIAISHAHACSLDIDNNGQQDALTDGLLLIRHEFGLTGVALTRNAIGPDAQRTDSNEIAAYINSQSCQQYFDVDGNQSIDALTDGLLAIRYLFGLTGTALIQNALADNASRHTPNDIVQWFTQSQPLMEIDTSFGTNGSTITSFYDSAYIRSSEGIKEMRIAPDGGIIVLGSAKHTFLETGSQSKYFPILAKYNTDGVLDLKFGNNGKSDIYRSGNWSVIAGGLGVNDTGDIFVGVDVESPFNDAIRIDTLSLDGKIKTQPHIFANFIENSLESWHEGIYWLVMRNNKPVVGGDTGSEDNFFSSDPSAYVIDPFNVPQKYGVEFGGDRWDVFYDAVVQSDGKLLAVGKAQWQNTDPQVSHAWALARFNTNGTLDTTFGSNGKAMLSITDGYGDAIYAVALQSDGKIIVRGVTAGMVVNSPVEFIARFNTNGILDTTFGSDGMVDLGMQALVFGSNILIQPNDKILFVRRGNSSTPSRLKRLNQDGDVDITFGDDGKGFDIGDTSVTPWNMQLQPDGKIIFAGTYFHPNSNSDFWIARYHLLTQ